jgi:hypothetical protein
MNSTQQFFSVPGDPHCYISSDSIADGDSGEGVFSGPEFLGSLEEPGIPPHELRLKIGRICRLTRNFDASRGLTKNIRVIVHNLLRHGVEVETISSVVAGEVVNPASRSPFLGNSSRRINCIRSSSDSTSLESIAISNLVVSSSPFFGSRCLSHSPMRQPSMGATASQYKSWVCIYNGKFSHKGNYTRR